MIKEDLISFIVYILMLAVAAIVGFAIISPAFKGVSTIGYGWNVVGYLIVCLIIAIIIEVIFFEIAHAIGAKIGKYKILSINVLGFSFNKHLDEKSGKYKVKFKFPSNFDGLTGETLIAPTSEKSNPMYYTFAPLFLFAIEAALLVVFYLVITKPKTGQNPLDFVKYFQLIIVTVGGMLFIYDYTPAKLDSVTDGYRLVLLNKKINVRAYNVLLNIRADEFLGNSSEKYETFTEITDFTSEVNIASVRNFLKKDHHEEALELVNQIIDSKTTLSFETRTVAKIYKLNIILYYKTSEEAKAFYESFNEKETEYLKSNYTMLTIRTAILYYGIVEKSNSECENQIHQVKKALEKESAYSKKYEEDLLRKTIVVLKEKNNEIEATY